MSSKVRPTQTLLDKVKKRAKKLDSSLGSLQQRQEHVAKEFGYNSFQALCNSVKNYNPISFDTPFRGYGCISGEFIVNNQHLAKSIHIAACISMETYEISYMFDLKSNQVGEKEIKALFSEHLLKCIEDFAGHILRVDCAEYSRFVDEPVDYSLGSLDIAIGIDIPKNIKKEDIHKFAQNWFYDEGKGERISISNFPNNGKVSRKAVRHFLGLINPIIANFFKTDCYTFAKREYFDIPILPSS